MKISQSLKLDLSKLWSAVAAVAATGALTALVPPQYRGYAAAVGAVVLALHPSPVVGHPDGSGGAPSA
jgi:hypothetical protein